MPGGELIAGNRGGGVALLGEMHSTRPLARLLSALRLSGLLDWLDVLFSRWRSWLSRFTPKGPAPCRYP